MGAGVMFISGGDTLILRRVSKTEDRWSGYWNFPGGKTEGGETHYETAMRELYEEVGGDPSENLIGVEKVPFQIYDELYGSGYTLYLAEVSTKFTPILDNENDEWKWVPFSYLSNCKLHPKDRKPILDKFI